MTTINTQEMMTQAVVGVRTVSVMSTVMGIMMGTMTASTMTVPVTELKGTTAAVRELKLAFGGNLVDKAVKNVSKDSMLALAQEVERLVIAEMYQQYGQVATDTALRAAVPGDIQSARVIAASLAGRGYGKAAPPREVPPTVVEGAKEVAKKRGRQTAKPVLDTKTGMQYKSKASAGMSVAAEYDLDPTNTFIWYAVVKKDPTRFKEISVINPKAPVSSASAYTLPTPHAETFGDTMSISDAMKQFDKEQGA